VGEDQIDRWARLEHVLRERGVDLEEFEAQAVRDIEAASPGRGTSPGRTEFATDEAAILEEGGFDLEPIRRGETDIALQTAVGLAMIEATALSVAEVASALGVTRARIRQRAAERTLHAIRGDDEWRFPRWQFDEHGRPRPGVATVMPEMPRDIHPLAVSDFMTHSNPDLEIRGRPVSPLEWLAADGEPEPVTAIARDL
jgi:hypothetical protein